MNKNRVSLVCVFRYAERAMTDYEKIEGALHYIESLGTPTERNEPSLADLAKASSMSPTHFQKTFTKWVGISPKQFMQYVKIERAKKILAEQKVPLASAAYRAGLSGTGRLHDLFLRIERMTPGEYAQNGEGLLVEYSFQDSLFGKYIVAATDRGICWLRFIQGSRDEEEAFLKKQWPRAVFKKKEAVSHIQVQRFFTKNLKKGERITLHLRGTPFQTKVWEALLQIPEGKLIAYADVAISAGNKKAIRAAASAVGDNPICYLIPCHRVIRGTGAIGQYSGGQGRKIAMIGSEASGA
jgi:AraC family transcriptional regulator of adaptative response/methylated-DNA-[protein]-cysteine methyltransferase